MKFLGLIYLDCELTEEIIEKISKNFWDHKYIAFIDCKIGSIISCEKGCQIFSNLK